MHKYEQQILEELYEQEILEELQYKWMTASEIAEFLNVKRTTIALYLKRLVNQQLIKRRNRYMYKPGRPFVEYGRLEVD